MLDSKASSQLGIHVSTANARLRKMILFRLVVMTGLDNCFVCGAKISAIDELSIEHKQPWLDRDPSLFWDLDNIAFSHRRCNRPHPRQVLHGRQKAYQDGCRCVECKAAHATNNREWRWRTGRRKPRTRAGVV